MSNPLKKEVRRKVSGRPQRARQPEKAKPTQETQETPQSRPEVADALEKLLSSPLKKPLPSDPQQAVAAAVAAAAAPATEEEREPDPAELEVEAVEVAEVEETPEVEEVAAAPEGGRQRSPYDGDISYTLYFQDIGKTKLLTPEEEVQLAGLIKAGDEEARERMIKANLRLVVKIAREYEGYGLPLLDLINEGNIGLMKAVERFDPMKGGKLSTYGSWWIKQSIRRALANQAKTIRLPVHVVDKVLKMRRAAIKLQEDLGREPTDEELGAEVGMSAARVSQLRTAAIRPASLEAPLGDDEGRLSDVVRDENVTTPYEQLEEKTVTSMLHELVNTLQPREANILRFRFGLDGSRERTLEEVGEKFGVTRERIRQLQNIALNKLRKKIEELEAVREAA